MSGKFVRIRTAGGSKIIVNTKYIVSMKPHREKPSEWTEVHLTTDSFVVDQPLDSVLLSMLGGWSES